MNDDFSKEQIEKFKKIKLYYYSNIYYDCHNDPDLLPGEARNIIEYEIENKIKRRHHYFYDYDKIYRKEFASAMYYSFDVDKTRDILIDRCHFTNNVHYDGEGNAIPWYELPPNRDLFKKNQLKYKETRDNFEKIHKKLFDDNHIEFSDKETKKISEKYWGYEPDDLK